MGYLHIKNLHADKTILMFKEVYALEKVHGTSAHVSYDPSLPESERLHFFSGGANHLTFKLLFNPEELAQKFAELGRQEKVTVYGEAYGGSMQGMKHTYGDKLLFIVFDVMYGESWLPVPHMDEVATTKLGFEVVPWQKVSTDLDVLDALRDAPSEVAVRRGITEPRHREGIVLRPLVEMSRQNADRIIAKHKGAAFSETATVRKVKLDDASIQVIEDAEKAALEYVTETRLDHVLDKLPQATGKEHTGIVNMAMLEDVFRESEGEVPDTKENRKAISKRTTKLFHARIEKIVA